MALFEKNWFGWLVNQGEPFTINYLNRAFGNRKTRVFHVSDSTGAVIVGTRKLKGGVGITYGGSAGAPTITMQIRDAAGNPIAHAERLSVWVSATAGATPIGTDTTGLTTTVTTGSIALTKLANLDFDIITDTTGKFTIVLTDAAGATTRFVNVALDGKIYSSKAIISPP